MITYKIAGSVLAVLAIAQTTRCDTVTIWDHHVSRHGRVVSLSAGTLTLEARFASGVELYRLSVKEVEKIDFDGIFYNVGDARPFGIGPARDGADKPKSDKLSTSGGDLIIFKKERPRKCTLLSIDADQVHCLGEREGIPRSDVLRVSLGAGK